MATSGLSRGDLLVLVAVLALFGIADSAYLAWQWYDAASSSWCDLTAFFSCTKVQDSPYSALAGTPTAFVGVGGFGVLLALASLGLRGVDRIGPASVDSWLLGVVLGGAILGTGLTFVELLVIQAICVLCAIGFALDLGILAVVMPLRRSKPRR